jgi:hypothetical protein
MKRSLLLAIITFFGISICPATEAMLSNVSSDGGYVDGTAGWTFSPTADISVTALGVLDYIYTAPNEGPISVGLWNQAGTMLTSSSVASNSFLLNSTRYESVTPTFLSAGLTYYIGAYAPGGTLIMSGEAPLNGGSAVMAPEIQLGMAVSNPNAFGFPTTPVGDAGSALLAPNFQFVDAVPEPSSGAFFILGAALLAKNRMKRTKPAQ